eukprot:GHVQ01042991.1.p1 GENE.GHVQ01042991.1~~GHVQ01042991.1.p1  ORF type:complete len:129 (-),score=24.10 GHVQ01042991.1:135-521(-)
MRKLSFGFHQLHHLSGFMLLSLVLCVLSCSFSPCTDTNSHKLTFTNTQTITPPHAYGATILLRSTGPPTERQTDDDSSQDYQQDEYLPSSLHTQDFASTTDTPPLQTPCYRECCRYGIWDQNPERCCL